MVLAYAGPEKQRETQLLILNDSVPSGFQRLPVLDIFRINQYLIRESTTSFLDFADFRIGISHCESWFPHTINGYSEAVKRITLKAGLVDLHPLEETRETVENTWGGAVSWRGCLGTDFRDELLHCFHFNYWELFGGKVFTSRKQVIYKERVLLFLEALEPREYKSRMWTRRAPNSGFSSDFFNLPVGGDKDLSFN